MLNPLKTQKKRRQKKQKCQKRGVEREGTHFDALGAGGKGQNPVRKRENMKSLTEVTKARAWGGGGEIGEAGGGTKHGKHTKGVGITQKKSLDL